MDEEVKDLIKNGSVKELIRLFTLSERRIFFGYEYEDDIAEHFSREEIIGVVNWFCC